MVIKMVPMRYLVPSPLPPHFTVITHTPTPGAAGRSVSAWLTVSVGRKGPRAGFLHHHRPDPVKRGKGGARRKFPDAQRILPGFWSPESGQRPSINHKGSLLKLRGQEVKPVDLALSRGCSSELGSPGAATPVPRGCAPSLLVPGRWPPTGTQPGAPP